MGYNLTVDRGNSAIKVALYEGDTLCAEFTMPRLEASTLLRAIGANRRIDGAIYCSVAHDDDADIEAVLRRFTSRVMALTPEMPLPVRLNYEHAERLGVDRIAAVAGAQALLPGREVLVIDAGTAVTYDRLRADGTFDGGNIAPGLMMRLRSLHHFTAALPLVDMPEPAPALFGHSTVEAMQRGALYGIVAEMEYYRRRLPRGAVTVITGGCAQLIADTAADPSIIVDQHLVTNGLNRILQYNEPK